MHVLVNSVTRTLGSIRAATPSTNMSLVLRLRSLMSTGPKRRIGETHSLSSHPPDKTHSLIAHPCRPHRRSLDNWVHTKFLAAAVTSTDPAVDIYRAVHQVCERLFGERCALQLSSRRKCPPHLLVSFGREGTRRS